MQGPEKVYITWKHSENFQLKLSSFPLPTSHFHILLAQPLVSLTKRGVPFIFLFIPTHLLVRGIWEVVKRQKQ